MQIDVKIKQEIFEVIFFKNKCEQKKHTSRIFTHFVEFHIFDLEHLIVMKHITIKLSYRSR